MNPLNAAEKYTAEKWYLRGFGVLRRDRDRDGTKGGSRCRFDRSCMTDTSLSGCHTVCQLRVGTYDLWERTVRFWVASRKCWRHGYEERLRVITAHSSIAKQNKDGMGQLLEHSPTNWWSLPERLCCWSWSAAKYGIICWGTTCAMSRAVDGLDADFPGRRR